VRTSTNTLAVGGGSIIFIFFTLTRHIFTVYMYIGTRANIVTSLLCRELGPVLPDPHGPGRLRHLRDPEGGAGHQAQGPSSGNLANFYNTILMRNKKGREGGK
jgi:hypothetical protein